MVLSMSATLVPEPGTKLSSSISVVKFTRMSETSGILASATSILPTQLAQSMPSTRIETLGGDVGSVRETGVCAS